MQDMKIEPRYQFLETKIPTTRHKLHSKFHSKLKPWDGRQMVDIEFLFYILVKIWIKKFHETNINKLCSIKFIHI
jgi:hypothetical protein